MRSFPWHWCHFWFSFLWDFSLSLLSSRVHLLNACVLGGFSLGPLYSITFFHSLEVTFSFLGLSVLAYLSGGSFVSPLGYGLSTRCLCLVEGQVLQIQNIWNWTHLFSQISFSCVPCFCECCYFFPRKNLGIFVLDLLTIEFPLIYLLHSWLSSEIYFGRYHLFLQPHFHSPASLATWSCHFPISI